MQGQNKNQDNTEVDVDSMYMYTIKEMIVNNPNSISNDNNIKYPPKNNLIDVVQLYPNPANSYVEISYANKVDGEFVIYNAIGDIILKAKLSKDYFKQKVYLHDLANGLYQYQIRFTDGEKQFGKLSILK